MPVFDVAEQKDVQNQTDEAMASSYDPIRDNSPGFFDNSLTSVGHGWLGASANLANLGVTAAHKTGFIDDEFMKDFDGAFTDYKKQVAPNPNVTGYLGKVLYPTTTMLLEAVPAAYVGGTLAAVGVTGGAEGVAQTKELIAEGVDKSTATKVGMLTGATAGLGIALPAAIPGKLLTRIASGAGINLAIGAAQRGATAHILDANGYTQMADQYKVLDGAALLTDAILGSAFGALHTLGTKTPSEPLPSVTDTGLAANNIHQLEIDSAPGIPADIQTRNSHIEAMETASNQVFNNEPVAIAQHFDEPNFVPKDLNPEIRQGMQEALRENGIYELEDTLHDIPYQVPDKLPLSKPPVSLLEFLSKRGGLQDITGELRSMGAHEWHLEKKFRGRLVKGEGIHPDDATLTAHEHGYFPEINDRPEINDLYDKIEMELKGRKQYPHSFLEEAAHDPEYLEFLSHRMTEEQGERLNIEIAEHREAERAEVERQEKEWFESRGDAWEPINSRRQIRDSQEYDPRTLEELENEYRQEISTARQATLYSNIERPTSARVTKEASTEGEGEHRGTSEPAGRVKEKERDESQQDINLANEIATNKPDLKVIDDEGNIITANEALAKADAEVVRAEKESSLFEVAVNCFIRNGL